MCFRRVLQSGLNTKESRYGPNGLATTSEILVSVTVSNKTRVAAMMEVDVNHIQLSA